MSEQIKIGVNRFDWSLHHSKTRRGIGMDAAGGSGSFAFLESQLELLDPKLVEPLQETTYERDFPIEYGGGFPDQLVAYASDYAGSGRGVLGFQGTNNTDIPVAQANLRKGVWPANDWAYGFDVSWFQLQKLEFARTHGTAPPFTLQQLYEESVRTEYQKVCDLNAYWGILGSAGLVNNPNVPSFVVPNPGSGSAWASKTPAQILADINFGLNATVKNSGFATRRGMATNLLLPYNQFALLTQPMTTAGYESILDYVEKNCVAAHVFGNKTTFKIEQLPDPWITGQGIGNTSAQGVLGNGLDRAIFYRNSREDLLYKIPTPMTPIMTVPKGPGWSTYFAANLGAIMFKRTTTVVYADGI